jgi:hypothetical protein
MNSSTMMIHLQRGNWWVRDHTDEGSICRWRIAGVEGLRGLRINKRPRWLCHGPSRRRQQHSRVEGKSFGMELGALEREGRRCITFSLSPCLCCYSLGAIDHPTHEIFAWVDGGASPHHVNTTGRKRRLLL